MTDTAAAAAPAEPTPVDTVPATINVKLSHADYSGDYPVFARAHISPGFDAFLVYDGAHRAVFPVTANVDDQGNPIPTGPTTALAPPIPGIDASAMPAIQQLIAEAVRQGIAAGLAAGGVTTPTPPGLPDVPGAGTVVPSAPLVDATTGETVTAPVVAAPVDLGFPAAPPALGTDTTPSGTVVEAPSVTNS